MGFSFLALLISFSDKFKIRFVWVFSSYVQKCRIAKRTETTKKKKKKCKRNTKHERKWPHFNTMIDRKENRELNRLRWLLQQNMTWNSDFLGGWVFCDYSILVMLYEMGEVSFHALDGREWFSGKGRERFFFREVALSLEPQNFNFSRRLGD